MRLYRWRVLRSIFVPMLRLINPGDIRIRHHWSPNSLIQLHSFKHKGYWYHGRNRERATMQAFGKLVNKGETAIEIGGHIGYVSIYLADLIGDGGALYVFEPGPNNIVYLQNNLKERNNVMVIEQAVGSQDGEVVLYVENLTGQNNTIVPNYHVFRVNQKRAFTDENYREVKMTITRLDTFLAKRRIRPDFIKIDVEGAELEVLGGMGDCLERDRPKMMVEVTTEYGPVHDVLSAHGYIVLDDLLRVIKKGNSGTPNWFCLHERAHSGILKELA